MSSLDIGIDLGTTSVIVYMHGKGIILREPSVVAVDTRNDTVIAVGKDAFEMVGKTPAYISAVHPLKDGVISDHVLTVYMIKEFLRKTSHLRSFRYHGCRIQSSNTGCDQCRCQKSLPGRRTDCRSNRRRGKHL